MCKPGFISATKYCRAEARKFLHTVTVWGHMDHKLLYAYFTRGLQMALSHHREGTRNTLNLNLEIVLVTGSQIKVKLLNRSLPDLLPLMCTGRDVQSTSLV